MLTSTRDGYQMKIGCQVFGTSKSCCKVTPGQLNKAIAITVDFVNNKYEDPKSGPTIFHNSRKVVTSANKRKIFSIMSHLMIEKKVQSYQRINRVLAKHLGRPGMKQPNAKRIEWSQEKQ
jgi:hypothetical protein